MFQSQYLFNYIFSPFILNLYLFLLAVVVLTIECMEFQSTCDCKPVIKPIIILFSKLTLMICKTSSQHYVLKARLSLSKDKRKKSSEQRKRREKRRGEPVSFFIFQRISHPRPEKPFLKSKCAVQAQVAQARNMNIGEHRHCCVTFKI